MMTTSPSETINEAGVNPGQATEDEKEEAPTVDADADVNNDAPASPTGAPPALTAQQRARFHQLLQQRDLDLRT